MDISENKSYSQQEDDYLPPIVSSYNDETILPPLFDCADKLRRSLNVMQQCIQPPPVPTIVLVGDRCSVVNLKFPSSLMGKRGHRSRTDDDDDEWHVALEISRATNTIAGTTNGISNNPLTLLLKKKGFPNLTIVDLPGIPTLDEANKEIYERIHQMILNYITPEDRIILNILSASTDSLPKKFESMNISKKVDKKCERTLVVVTNADNAPHKFLNELVLDKVTAMGLNYVCVRNNIDLETLKESEIIEATLFETNEFLSKINKSMVSIPVLARKLMIIQVKITSTDIQRKIKDRLNANVTELKKLPSQCFSTVAEALRVVMQFVTSAKKLLQTILPGGNKFDDHNEDCTMYKKSLQTMLDQYSAQLHSKNLEKKEDFLMEEIMYIKDRMVNGLSIDFLSFLHEKVDGISKMAEEFVGKMWNCIERVIIDVLMHHFDSHPQLQDSTGRAVQNLIAQKNDESANWVREIIGMEKLAIDEDDCTLEDILDEAGGFNFMALHMISAVGKMVINNEMEEYIANYLTTSNEIEEAPETAKA
uniref:Dynamin-related protein 4C-like n=1 Tax=Nicotiana tabacum TaxID=4097 RepID=A0A1S4A712_TOBAC|nr:PREDICTED: dynamin-related protein 4C-like [Nicotiana tabacum]